MKLQICLYATLFFCFLNSINAQERFYQGSTNVSLYAISGEVDFTSVNVHSILGAYLFNGGTNHVHPDCTTMKVNWQVDINSRDGLNRYKADLYEVPTEDYHGLYDFGLTTHIATTDVEEFDDASGATFIIDVNFNDITVKPNYTYIAVAHTQKRRLGIWGPGWRNSTTNTYNVHECYNPCLPNWTITTPFFSGDTEKFEASNTIVGSNTINAGANITYDAQNLVTLTPGFHAKSGSTFHAYIDGCGGLRLSEPAWDNVHPELTGEEEQPATPKPKIAKELVKRNALRCSPNPFQASTTIEYELEEDGQIFLSIQDVNGRIIKKITENYQPQGLHKIEFDGATLPAGVYFVNLQTRLGVETLKLMLVH